MQSRSSVRCEERPQLQIARQENGRDEERELRADRFTLSGSQRNLLLCSIIVIVVSAKTSGHRPPVKNPIDIAPDRVVATLISDSSVSQCSRSLL